MQASIHSLDDERAFDDPPSKGKTSRVRTEDFALTAKPTHLLITARSSRSLGSGARGGLVREFQSTLTLKLSPRDLQRIADAALAAGLIRLSVAVATKTK